MDIEKVEHNVKEASGLLKALSSERRLMIVCALYKGEKSVGELEQIVGLSQSALSQHLAKLRQCKIVSTRRDAQTIYYSISDPAAHAVLKTLHDIFCPDEKSDGKP